MLTVIILNYFGSKLTQKCVNSIQKKDKIIKQIIIIDNSNNKEEKKLLENLFNKEKKINLIFSTENLGFSKGINLGIKEAINSGDQQFLIINNDAYLTKDALEIIDAKLKKSENILISPTIDWDNNAVGFIYYHKYLSLLSYCKKTSSSWIPYFSGCTLAFKKQLIDSIGYFDEKFFMYGEDIAFSNKAISNKTILSLLPQTLIIHKGSSSSKKSSLFYEYHVNRGHILLVESLANGITDKIIMYILRFFILIFKGVLRSLRYKSLIPFVGSILAWFPLKIRPKHA